MKKLIGLLALPIIGLSAQTSAAVVLSGTGIGNAYTQNFNNIPAPAAGTNLNGTLPTDWLHNAGSATYRGITESGGSFATNRWLSLHNTGVTNEQALGIGINNIPGYLGVTFQNGTGASVSQLFLDYTGEQWAGGAGGWTVEYQTSSTPISSLSTGSWTSVAAWTFTNPQPGSTSLDGNAAGNRTAISATETSLAWANNDYLALRWTRTGTTAVGIDDITVYADVAVPEPATVALWLGMAAVGLIAWRRRRQQY